MYIVHSLAEASRGHFILVFICLLQMVTFALVKVSMHMWSYSCATNINAPDVTCGGTRELVVSFCIKVSWRFPSCVNFHTTPFGS